jgi:hypothetical protein
MQHERRTDAAPRRVPSSEVDHLERVRIHTAQCARFTPVRPLAKLAVEPEDFPFLDRMLAHDDERLALFGEAVQQG